MTETAPFVGISDAGLGGDKSGPIGWDTVQIIMQVWIPLTVLYTRIDTVHISQIWILFYSTIDNLF